MHPILHTGYAIYEHRPPRGREVKHPGPGSLGLVYGNRLSGLAGSALGRLVSFVSSLVSLVARTVQVRQALHRGQSLPASAAAAWSLHWSGVAVPASTRHPAV